MYICSSCCKTANIKIMSKQAFQKFINKEPTGAKKKEALRQEKKKIKAEARAAGEEFRRKKREQAQGTRFGGEDAGYKKQDTRNKKGDTRYNIQDTGYRKKDTRDKKEDTRDRIQDTGYKRQDTREEGKREIGRNRLQKENKSFSKKRFGLKNKIETIQPETRNLQPETEFMPLNKFIAHAGICGRREAAELVKQGIVTVNGTKISEPGFKVSPKDKIVVKGNQVFLQKSTVYILLNKPKDYITTTEDPQGRKTVLDLLHRATKERVYPVGRLDRNTTGVLLLTNDGELAQKLTHPSYEVKKIYEVKLDKPLAKKDYDAILNGVTLEDGLIAADMLAYADAKDRSIIGIEVHSGRNRIVRRLFEHLGYDIKNLDRVMFANLTKKNVERGKYRFLTEKEIRLLKYMNQAFVRKKPPQTSPKREA